MEQNNGVIYNNYQVLEIKQEEWNMIASLREISTAAVVTAVTLSMATIYVIMGANFLPKSSKKKLRGPKG